MTTITNVDRIEAVPADSTTDALIARLTTENAALKVRAEVAEKAWQDALLKRGYAGRPEQRNAQEVLVSLAQLAEEHLAVSRHILAALNSSSDSRSSAEVKTSTRGYDISVKAYEGSPTEGLVEQAVAMYGEAFREVQERSARQWSDTVAELAEARAK